MIGNTNKQTEFTIYFIYVNVMITNDTKLQWGGWGGEEAFPFLLKQEYDNLMRKKCNNGNS